MPELLEDADCFICSSPATLVCSICEQPICPDCCLDDIDEICEECLTSLDQQPKDEDE